MDNPLLGMIIVMAVFAGLMSALCLYQRTRSPHPEFVRKLFHMGMGLFTLALPRLFASFWPVLILSVATIGVMIALRRVARFKSAVGGVICSVERRSFGDIYFPLGVAALFYLSEGDGLLYSIPILILALADAVAALVGVRYGRRRFQSVEGHKSVEGSVTFFALAFLSSYLPLLMLGDVGRAKALLIALMLGSLITIIEAVSWRGLDNLLIPVVAFVILKLYMSMSMTDLLTRMVVMIVLSAFVFLYGKQTSLNGAGILGAILMVYLCWALVGWRWMMASAFIFLSYALVSMRNESDIKRACGIQSAFNISLIWLAWMLPLEGDAMNYFMRFV